MNTKNKRFINRILKRELCYDKNGHTYYRYDEDERFCNIIGCKENGGGNESDPMAYACYGCDRRKLYADMHEMKTKLELYMKLIEESNEQFIKDVEKYDIDEGDR